MPQKPSRPNVDPENAGETETDSAGNRSVLRACSILRCFDQKRLMLGLAEVAEATQLSKATTYRILGSLVAGGMLELRGKNTYALPTRALHRRTYRIGYAAQTEEYSFSRLVADSVRCSAYEAGLELLVLNNRYSPTTAIRNAETFVREHVDLVIEFQTYQESASTVASRLVDASIPIIAIEIPHPGAIFYGANNYRAGLIAGRALAQACIARWKGKFDELLLVELPAAGSLVGSRLTGIVDGLREKLPDISDNVIQLINGAGRFETSLGAVRKHLSRHRQKKVLIGAVNDPSCLGALDAFAEVGRSHDCLAVSHNGALETRRELRKPGSSLVGSVAYFPEQYGEAVIQLALDKLQGHQVPAATFVKHHLLTPETVDTFYPNDRAWEEREGDSLLYSRR